MIMPTISLTVLLAMISLRLSNSSSAKNHPSDSLNITIENRKFKNSVFYCNISEQGVVDCSRRNLTFVPYLPLSSVVIRLDANNLKNISNTPFLGMDTLETLNLSSNPLRYISSSLFEGLDNLKHLYLKDVLLYQQNGLDLNTLFKDTVSLIDIRITFQEQAENSCSSKHALFKNITTLRRVRNFELDWLIFRHFKDAKAEKNLSLIADLTVWNGKHSCANVTIEKRLFSFFPSLEMLFIYTPGLTSHDFYLQIEADAFVGLENLRELTISNATNTLADDIIRNVSISVSNLTHLEVLRLTQLGNWKSGYLYCFTPLDLKCLSQLKTLDLSGNNLTGSCVPKVSRSIVSLVISENHMPFIYLNQLINESPNIEYIHAESQFFKAQCTNGDQKRPKQSNVSNTPSAIREIRYSNVYHICDNEILFESNHDFPNLTYMKYQFNNPDFKNALSVPSDFSKRRPRLKYLELKGCGIFVFAKGALQNMDSITTLKLPSNYLGTMIGNLSREVQHLSSLEILDLANNDISTLDNEIFKKLYRLTYLDLSRNSLQTLPSLGHLTNLVRLNISFNSFAFLSTSVRTDLNNINGYKFSQLDISDNPLRINCDTLDFLPWITNTHIAFLNGHKTTFSLSDIYELPLSRTLDDIHEESLFEAQLQCYIVIVIVGMSILLILLMFTLLLYCTFGRRRGYKPCKYIKSCWRRHESTFDNEFAISYMSGTETKSSEKMDCADSLAANEPTYDNSKVISVKAYIDNVTSADTIEDLDDSEVLTTHESTYDTNNVISVTADINKVTRADIVEDLDDLEVLTTHESTYDTNNVISVTADINNVTRADIVEDLDDLEALTTHESTYDTNNVISVTADINNFTRADIVEDLDDLEVLTTHESTYDTNNVISVTSDNNDVTTTECIEDFDDSECLTTHKKACDTGHAISVRSYDKKVSITGCIKDLQNSECMTAHENTYDYNAFISYTDEDFEVARTGCIENLENLKGLKLCLHERDFKPGHQIAHNISTAIRSSRHTICFVSKYFLCSHWCMYELEVARTEAVNRRKNVILIVLLDSNVKNKLPTHVIDIVRIWTYLEYPEHGSIDDVKLFWDKLANFIQQP